MLDMKKTLNQLILFCWFFNSLAYANNWDLVNPGNDGSLEHYVDYSGARIVDKNIEYWSLTNYEPPKSYGSSNYSSRVQKNLTNCKSRETLTAHVYLYQEKMGKGALIGSISPPQSNPWQPIPPTSLANTTAKILCKKFKQQY